MEWLGYMNAALDYIEDNLSIKVDIEKVASKAGCSSYNFQRMFSFIADVTLAAYIRRRCMTAAAMELSKNQCSVIDLALKYGYDSPVSFARAFYQIHGITPQEARIKGAKLSLYPRISFQISIKGASVMKYRIEQMDGFTLAGISKKISTKNGENFTLVPKMWEDAVHDGSYEKLYGINHREQEETFGVCYDMHFQEEWFRYMIAIRPMTEISKDYEVLNVPAGLWVKFETDGVNGIQNVFKRMFTEWFPTSGYEHADGPEIELYPIGDMNSDDYKCEVWIPICPKKSDMI